MGDIKFSIVIPTMWISDKIYTMLEIYQKSKYVDEVIIIDNNPKERPRINDSKVKLVTRGTNIYVNPAWNWGVSLCKNHNIIIANDDIIIRNLDALLEVFDSCEYDLVGADIDATRENGHISISDAPVITYGFGCFMFVRKDKYITIPDNLKIWRGDSLLRKNLKSGKFGGVLLDTKMSESVNTLKHIAKKDTQLYREWKQCPKDITLIVENSNNVDTLKRCISSFLANVSANYFIIVIDNTNDKQINDYLYTLDRIRTMILLNQEPIDWSRCFDMGIMLSFPCDKTAMCRSTHMFDKNELSKPFSQNKVFFDLQ